MSYNKQLEESIIERGEETYKLVEKTFTENPQLNDTLTKMVLSDSRGQHKDNKNERRLSKKKTLALPQKTFDVEEYEILDEDVRSQYGSQD